jgi:hypothetical protein
MAVATATSPPEEEEDATILEAKFTTNLDDAQRSAHGEVVI